MAGEDEADELDFLRLELVGGADDADELVNLMRSKTLELGSEGGVLVLALWCGILSDGARCGSLPWLLEKLEGLKTLGEREKREALEELEELSELKELGALEALEELEELDDVLLVSSLWSGPGDCPSIAAEAVSNSPSKTVVSNLPGVAGSASPE